jgi:amino acid adenylation domain-containing protein
MSAVTGVDTVGEFDPFAGPALERVIPTTEAQREVWLADRLSREASLAYNESITLHLHGELDAGALGAALAALYQRHEALRATFSDDGREMFVGSQVDVPLVQVDLSARDTAARELAVAAEKRAAVETPFDLLHGPLVRTTLLRLGAREHVLIFTAHHIVCDGYSFGVIARDLAALYAARRGGTEAALPAPDAYGDYAADELAYVDTEEHRAAEAFWVGRFQGNVPILDLPTDRPRRTWRTFASTRIDRWFDAELTDAVRKLGARNGASLFATLLAGFGATLNRISGAQEVVLGVPSAGQSATAKTTLVGHCVNLLPITVAVDERAAFQDLVKSTRTAALDAFEHQRFTFGSLLKKLAIKRDPSRLPLVSVMFNLDQALEGDSIRLVGLETALSGNPRSFENFELFLNVVQAEGALRLECQYNTDLFDAATVERWLTCYELLLREACAAPDASLASLRIVSNADLAQLHAWNATIAEYPATQLVHELVEQQCAATPGTSAVVCGRESLTYAQLDGRANAIAAALEARGVGPGALVGISLERSLDLVPAVLGVLKTGAGYVPLDPSYPRDRLEFMAQDAAIAVLITDAASREAFSWPADQVLLLDANVGAGLSRTAPKRPGTDAVAYVIFTSGSTGKPKGVQVPHRAVVNFLCSMRATPGYRGGDRLVAVTTLSFDIAVNELLTPLVSGATVVLATRTQALDGFALRALVEESGATLMQATPATWRMLLEAGWQGGAGFRAMCGGEALDRDLAQRLLASGVELWNMYGPTETTVWSTCWKVERDAPISIGTPIANTTVWVLDAANRPTPVGVPGEIWIGGDGVTLGYLHRPELTAERFVPDPFRPGEKAHIYRTGDRGRWRNDGTLEHLGRLDFQVKVRGYRIELGEIEAALASHASVAQAVVITREDRPGDVRLVGYVAGATGQAPLEAALRDHVKRMLPEYMVPQHVVVLPAIPLLPNGKVNRKALPAPDLSARDTASFLPPRTPLEKEVATIMGQVLGLPEVSVEDDFFALGGHSLLAAQLTAKLNRALGVNMPLRTLFEAPTVARLATAVEVARANGAANAPPALEKKGVRSTAALSMNQERLWFLEELNPGRVVYNTPSAHRLKGQLDVAALERALQELVARQSVLRTSIDKVDGAPVQHIHDHVEFSLGEIHDLSAVPAEKRETALLEQLDALVNVPFDLTHPPLFRVALFRLAPEEHVLFFMPHHIIWDGWSFDLFYDEISALYSAFREGRPSPLEPLAYTYGDYAEWHRDWVKSPEFEKQISFWRARLAGVRDVRELPTDRPRRPGMSGGGATEWLNVSPKCTAGLHELGRTCDATMFMTLLAAYVVLLQKTTGRDRLVIGTPVRGRANADVEQVMGYFTNLLPLQIDVDSQQTFSELVRRVKTVVLDAFTYPDVPLERLVTDLSVQRGEGGSLLYQALFSFQDARLRSTRWGNLEHSQVPLFQRGATEDLGLWVMETQSGMMGGVTYNTDIILRESAVALRDRYSRLLESLVAAADVPLSQVSMFTDADREFLDRVSTGPADASAPRALHAIVDAHAAAHPDRIAVADGGWGMKYRDLAERSNRIARALRARGVGAGDEVLVVLPRNLSMPVGVLGALKAGAVVSLAYAAEYSNDTTPVPADVRALVCTAETRSELVGAPEIVLEVDTAGPELAALSAAALEDAAANPNAPAIAVRYAGATGGQSELVLSHRAVASALADLARRLRLTDADVFLAASNSSADCALHELLLPLVSGATLAIAPDEAAGDAPGIVSALDRTKATALHAPASVWARLVAAGWKPDPGFRALHSGSPLELRLADALVGQGAVLHTAYGHPETGVWCTCSRLESLSGGVTAGSPLAGFRVEIVDDRGSACPVGVEGRIVVSGPGVPRTATQDRARWRADGELELRGAADEHVWYDRQRIDVGFVADVLRQHPGVRDAAVAIVGSGDGHSGVYAYVVPADDQVDSATLRRHLSTALPIQLQPHGVLRVPAVPRRPDGTLDVALLPSPRDAHRGAEPGHDEPQTPTEKRIAALWSSLLGVERVSLRDNFFDLGGHSLLAMQAISAMEKETGKRINPRRYLFESLAQVAKSYDDAEVTAPKKQGLLSRLFGRGRDS